jgi:hypothetical protein
MFPLDANEAPDPLMNTGPHFFGIVPPNICLTLADPDHTLLALASKMIESTNFNALALTLTDVKVTVPSEPVIVSGYVGPSSKIS